MTTVAGLKIKRHRETQEPRLTRTAFGGTLGGVRESTIQGWEDEGKVPRNRAMLLRLAAAGIAQLDDWYRPAVCPQCDLPGDEPLIASCRQAGCPLAELRVA